MVVGKQAARILVLCLMCLALAGCMYPQDMRKENQIATSEYIVVVQNAIDQYQAKTGVLPIKNSEETTPIFEKYPIEFKKLKERALISNVPANAFESGGSVVYMLVDVETKPAVKMMDLASFQQTVEAQKLVDAYKAKNNGQIPKGEAVAPSFYRLDFVKMNKKPLVVQSMYTRQVQLPLLMNEEGQVAIDYAEEIMRLIDKKSLQSQLNDKQDLRQLLVKEAFFVPARSYAYHWLNGQPTPVMGVPM
ncbi:hypothetical protein [Paenibacillus agricola]|uniref:Lipoprotein n=1 Tax=Paenibacillus agricola TaxID=2716264 RepID=A0ABX0J409_9BACL|nr:hypothetical protein [Paenibacillus agricola]NHN28734.1 hypothetical protein [Paenibacillus agricola]